MKMIAKATQRRIIPEIVGVVGAGRERNGVVRVGSGIVQIVCRMPLQIVFFDFSHP